MSTDSSGSAAFRVVVFHEILDSTGHKWDVPMWSVVEITARSAEEALEQALSDFENTWPCACWSDVATDVEVEEISRNTVADNELPASKRVVQADLR